MQGSYKVEKYMFKVSRALDHSGLSGQARTDVYNRCYEAVADAIRDHEPNVKESQKIANVMRNPVKQGVESER